jgi:hypothetical protein
MSSYTLYLDKPENFQCEIEIKNAKASDASARLIIECDDVNLIFYGEVSNDSINVPIKSLKKYFKEDDKATAKLEVVVEGQLITPWESEVLFENYNKVQIKEVKTAKQKPMVEVKVKSSETKVVVDQSVKKEEEPKQLSEKEMVLAYLNEEIKKINSDGKLNKAQKKQLIKNLLKNDL